MGQYRIKRAIEASLVDKITAWLSADSWTGIAVVKSRTEAYEQIPAICVELGDHDPVRKEIGSKTYIKYFKLSIRLFCKNDGQRLDLSSWLFDKLEDNVDYYNYTITNGIVSAKVLAGKIIIKRWLDDKQELTNTENLDSKDKFRHILRCEVYVA